MSVLIILYFFLTVILTYNRVSSLFKVIESVAKAPSCARVRHYRLSSWAQLPIDHMLMWEHLQKCMHILILT